ncbi:MAG: MATE family efflux transporter, partial [Aquaspirillum sp.]
MVADLFQRSASLREMRALLALALPMMVAQIAQVATGFVDTVMAGRVGTADLAAVSLGSSILITVTITFAGLLMALNPIIAHHFGAQ